MDRIGRRPAREEGFTLMELLMVVAIIGILVAVAVPAYMGFTRGASQKAASADVRAAIANAVLYGAEHGSFKDMTVAALRAYDSGLKIDHVVVLGAADDSYCVDKTVDGRTAKVTRGAAQESGGEIVEGAGPC
jgi:prepilin-type N-terminal cleavage/methylation domain-containing protein